jgi:ribA/ribD-fused uncharacterized protein
MRDQFMFFWGGPFSQWAKYTIEIDGEIYVTCEQYMMAEKARLFGDQEAEAKIMASTNPREQKALGRKVANFDAVRWEEVSMHIVLKANLAKFSQHEELKRILLATGDKIIAEASPRDAIWGIGMAEDHPNVTDRPLWGQNLLGKAIMHVRYTLRATADNRGVFDGDATTTLKLFHNDLLLAYITDVGSDQPWMFGAVLLTPQAAEYMDFFSFMTDESKVLEEPPFAEDLDENWFIEDAGGKRQAIDFPAVHEDNTIYWRWK